MNYFKLRKIFKTAKQISLSKKEKAVLREDFIRQIGFDVPVKSPFMHLLPKSALSRRVLGITVLAVCLVMITLTPLSYAAQRSLPGDYLYPWKVLFNETVKRGANKLIGGDTVQFEVEILKERISEANQLIERYQLTEKRKTEIKESLADQTERSKEVIENIQSEVIDSGLVKPEAIKEILPEVPKLAPVKDSIEDNKVIDTVETVVTEPVEEVADDILDEVDETVEETPVDDIVDEIDLPVVPGLLP